MVKEATVSLVDVAVSLHQHYVSRFSEKETALVDLFLQRILASPLITWMGHFCMGVIPPVNDPTRLPPGVYSFKDHPLSIATAVLKKYPALAKEYAALTEHIPPSTRPAQKLADVFGFPDVENPPHLVTASFARVLCYPDHVSWLHPTVLEDYIKAMMFDDATLANLHARLPKNLYIRTEAQKKIEVMATQTASNPGYLRLAHLVYAAPRQFVREFVAEMDQANKAWAIAGAIVPNPSSEEMVAGLRAFGNREIDKAIYSRICRAPTFEEINALSDKPFLTVMLNLPWAWLSELLSKDGDRLRARTINYDIKEPEVLQQLRRAFSNHSERPDVKGRITYMNDASSFRTYEGQTTRAWEYAQDAREALAKAIGGIEENREIAHMMVLSQWSPKDRVLEPFRIYLRREAPNVIKAFDTFGNPFDHTYWARVKVAD